MKGKKTGGRQKGTKNKAVSALLAQAQLKGLTPIQMMSENAEHFRSLSLTMEVNLRTMLEKVQTPEMLAAMTVFLDKAREYRMDCQKCASELAPYVHPRLQSITLGGDKNNPIAVEVTGGLPDNAGGL